MSLLRQIKNNQLFKTGLNYSLVGSVNSFAGMAVGLLIMRWLTPIELGLWNAVSIFQAYIPFFQLGIQSGLNRDLPVLLGKGDVESAKTLVANAKGYSLIMSFLFVFAGIFLSLYFYIVGKDLSFVLGVFTIALIAATTSQTLHLVATFRSSKSFDKLTKIMILDTIMILLLVAFIYKYHYYGILIYNGVKYTMYSLLMTYFSPYRKLKPQLKFKTLLNLSKTGLILMSFIQMRGIAQSIPRWLILYLGGVVKLGLFSPALAINGVMTMLPSQIAQFFHPQMGYKYGQTGNAKDMWPYIKKMLIIFPLLSLAVCLAFWFIAPWLLSTFFPKYTDSLWAMRIMAIAFVFSSAFTTHGVLYTIKAYKPAYLFSISELVGSFLFPYLVVHFFKSDLLASITIGLSINNFLLYILNTLILRRVLFLSKYNLS